MSNNQTTESTGKELLDRAVANIFKSGVDSVAAAKQHNRRGPSGKKVRTAQPTWAEQRAAKAASELPSQAQAPKELKPFNRNSAYKAELTKNQCRLWVKYLHEEVYLPKVMAELAATQLNSGAEVRVKLIDNDGTKPRIKVNEIIIGDFLLTLEDAKLAAESAKAKAEQDKLATTQVNSNAPRSQQMTGLTGKIKWFNRTKGFGFIVPDTGGKDVFVHVSAVERANLQGKMFDGVSITFDLARNHRSGKMHAVNLLVNC